MCVYTDNPSYFAVNQGLRRIVPLADRQRMARNKAAETGSMGRTRKGAADKSGNKCLTRSFSANIEEARLLVMGQPRPADVAPSVKHRRHTSTGNKVKHIFAFLFITVLLSMDFYRSPVVYRCLNHIKKKNNNRPFVTLPVRLSIGYK